MREFFINDWTNGGPVRIVLMILLIYFFVFLIFAIGKRLVYNARKGKHGLSKYEETMWLYLNAKKEFFDVLKKNVPFQVIFWLGVFLIWKSVDQSNFATETKDIMFTVGLVLSGLGLVVYFIKYIFAGGLKGIDEVWKNQSMKYAPPDYVTEITYLGSDTDPESDRTILSSYTYDKNLEHNMMAFIVNVIGFIFKIISFVALAMVYLLIELFESLKATFFAESRFTIKIKAKRDYYNFVMAVARDEGFVPKNIYPEGDVYNEIPNEVAKELLLNSRKSIASNSSKVFVFAHCTADTYFTCFSTRKYEMGADESHGRLVLVESFYTRMILPVPKIEDVEDGTKFIAVPIPYKNYYKFYPEQFNDDDSKPALIEMMMATQFMFLQKMKTAESGNKKVQLMAYENDTFRPLTAKLKDITLNEEEKTYSVENGVPVANLTEQRKSTSGLLGFLVFILTLISFGVILYAIIPLINNNAPAFGSNGNGSPISLSMLIMFIVPIIMIIVLAINRNKK